MPTQRKYLDKLAGKRVLIFGGTSGIGFSVAEAATEFGAHVIVSSSTTEKINATIKRLSASYPDAANRISGHRADLSDANTLEANIEATLKFVTNDGVNKLDHIVITAGAPAHGALADFTPHFLPPQETQATLSLGYLDAVTNMIHRLPDWDTFQHQRHKNDAYDDISKAWALVIKEAAKRAGGFHLSFGGWDQKLVEHNVKSNGKLEEAVNELRSRSCF